MIKALGTDSHGRKLLLLGLSFANLERFKQQPLDTFIRIAGAEMGLDFDVMLISGATEADMAAVVSNALTPDAKVHVDDRLKS
jgi:hypothetical protein